MITSYNFGRIVIDGEIYISDIIIYPNRVYSSWWRDKGHELCIQDIREIVMERPEILLVGTGAYGRMVVLSETERYLEKEGIALIARPTKEVCTLYNQMIKEDRKMIAALHLTC